MKLYALHDKKAKALSSFHVERSDAVASRGFAEAVKPDSVFAKYAEDFELVALADVWESGQQELPLTEQEMVQPFPMRVVITAAQVVASRPLDDRQLSLLGREA